MAEAVRIDLAPAAAAPGARSAEPDSRSTHRRSLFGPWVDFLLLGGGSFLVLGAKEGFGVREGRAAAPIGAPEAVLVGARWKAWPRSAPAGLARFILAGGTLGFASFRLAPVTIDALSGYDQAVFGATVFLFIGWAFINVHHDFMDSVIGRRENLETRRHRFTPFGRPAP